MVATWRHIYRRGFVERAFLFLAPGILNCSVYYMEPWPGIGTHCDNVLPPVQAKVCRWFSTLYSSTTYTDRLLENLLFLCTVKVEAKAFLNGSII